MWLDNSLFKCITENSVDGEEELMKLATERNELLIKEQGITQKLRLKLDSCNTRQTLQKVRNQVDLLFGFFHS